jgi:hypothetical protein
MLSIESDIISFCRNKVNHNIPSHAKQERSLINGQSHITFMRDLKGKKYSIMSSSIARSHSTKVQRKSIPSCPFVLTVFGILVLSLSD